MQCFSWSQDEADDVHVVGEHMIWAHPVFTFLSRGEFIYDMPVFFLSFGVCA